ncbi:MAG TPA: T9SS type A sorting domain-containing protein [Candidatus Kapabacteria bacterium]|nr:T9SS type A sorting domain-containing protein [Candidatus Kapabacteria bacterium]
MKYRFVARRAAEALTLALLIACAVPAARMNAQINPEGCSETEAWVPVDVGIEGTDSVCIRSAVMNNELYVVSRRQEQSGAYTLSAWNGTAWRTLAHFSAGSTVCNLTPFNGMLYISGWFDSLNHRANTAGLARWNGTALEAVPGNTADNTQYQLTFEFRAAIYPMVVYRNELYVAGFFHDAATNPFAGIMAFNGTTWRTIASYPPGLWYTDSIMINTMVEWHGDLYVGGFFRTMGGVAARGIAKWDGSAWSAVDSRDMRVVQHLFVYHDRLYAFRQWLGQYHVPAQDQHVTWWDDTSWHDVPDGPIRGRTTERPGESSVAEYNGSIYVTQRRLVPNNSTTQFRLDSLGIHTLARPDSVINMLQVYNGALYAGGEFTSACGVPLNHLARLCAGPDCAGISGRVIAGSDCDSGAAGSGVLAYRMVELQPGPRYAITNTGGYYRHFAEPGDYRLSLAPRPYWTQACPAAPPWYSLAVKAPGDSFPGRVFAAQPIPGIRDLSLSLTGGRARVQTAVGFTIECRNNGTAAAAGQLRFDFDSLLVFDSSSVPPARTTRSALTWNLKSLAPEESGRIRVWMHVAPGTSLGMQACAHAVVDCANDQNMGDNTQEYCCTILGSYDPNDIAVMPAGIGGFGELAHGDSVLTYTVRFENMGNDTAYRVMVVDSVSPNVDLASLALGAASHPYTLMVIGARTLLWRFDNIMLPASSAGNGAGQGYFTYSVRLARNLPPGTQIQNHAEIYFDYNLPVATNVVISSTASQSGADVRNDAGRDAGRGGAIYPNPTRGVAYIRGPLAPQSDVNVRDLMGRSVRQYRQDGSGEMMIDLSGLPSGVYIVTMQTPEGVRAERMLLQR